MKEKRSDRWEEILRLAQKIDQTYQELNKARLGRVWSNTEFLAAVTTDFGELTEEIMKWEGMRPGKGDLQAIEHELSDILWFLIVLSDRLNIDLADAFIKSMNDLEKRLGDKS